MNKITIRSSELQSKELTPKFYIVEGVVKKEGKVVNMVLYMGVHHCLDDAIDGLAIEVSVNQPDVFKTAKANGGIQIVQHKAVTPEKLNQLFNNHKKIEEKKESSNINQLMQALIGKGDILSVDKYKDQLTEAQIKYCKSTIDYNNNKKY